MKDFTYEDFTYYYYDDNNKRSLCIYNCNWLVKMGLKETIWILDAEWILTDNIPIFSEWIDE